MMFSSQHQIQCCWYSIAYFKPQLRHTLDTLKVRQHHEFNRDAHLNWKNVNNRTHPQTLNNLYTVCCICLKSRPAPSLESPNEQDNLARSASQGLQPDTRDYAQQAHAPIQRNTDLCLQVRAQLRQAHRHPSSWQSLASRSSPTVLPSSSTADACGSPVTQCSTEMSKLPNCTLSETMQYTLECMGNN